MDTEKIILKCSTLPEKFITRLKNFPEFDKCWIWEGPTDTKNKVLTARFSYSGISVCAHRFIWEEIFEEHLTQKNVIIQTCGNRLCCNPLHLEKRNKNEEHARKMKAAWDSLRGGKNDTQ